MKPIVSICSRYIHGVALKPDLSNLAEANRMLQNEVYEVVCGMQNEGYEVEIIPSHTSTFLHITIIGRKDAV